MILTFHTEFDSTEIKSHSQTESVVINLWTEEDIDVGDQIKGRKRRNDMDTGTVCVCACLCVCVFVCVCRWLDDLYVSVLCRTPLGLGYIWLSHMLTQQAMEHTQTHSHLSLIHTHALRVRDKIMRTHSFSLTSTHINTYSPVQGPASYTVSPSYQSGCQCFQLSQNYRSDYEKKNNTMKKYLQQHISGLKKQ